MRFSVLLVLVFVFSGGPVWADACENTMLTCSLEKPAGDSWKVVSQSSAAYSRNPLHCMARVALINPEETGRVFNAVASSDFNVVIFTTVAGEVDYELGAVIGVASPDSLIMPYGQQRVSCKVTTL